MNTRKLFRFAAAAACAAALALLGACLPPIDAALSSRLSDTTAPAVSLVSPVENSAYTQTVTVQGKHSKPGKLKSLAYSVTGTLGVLDSGTVPDGAIGADGSFSFQFSTLSFSGPIAITITATDWNDNVGQAKLMLTSPGSSISSFSATPASKKVTLSWEPIPGAAYTIYYTTNGTLPTQSYGSVATPGAPPYVVSGLTNGAMCTFLLQAHTAEGTDYWSGYTQTIPLSQFTLAPMVTGDYRQIRLEWSAISGTNQFVVARDTDPNGSFPSYSGVVTGTTFVDTNAADSTWYYYKVRTTTPGCLTSACNGAQTFLAPPDQGSGITTLPTPAPGYKLKVAGTLAYVLSGTSLWVVDISNPKAPVIAATLGGFTAASDIVINGSWAYVADGAAGLRVVNISNPLAPAISTTAGGFTNASALSMVTGLLFVMDTHFVKAFDISTPSSPLLSSTSPTSASTFGDVAATITGSTKYVYVCAGADGLLRYTYTTGFGSLVSYADVNYLANLVFVAPSTLTSDSIYVAGQARAFLEPPPPYVVMTQNVGTFAKTGDTSAYSTKGFLWDLTVLGKKAYVADGKGLQLIDVTSAAAPVVKQFWDNPGATHGVAVNAAASFAFVTTDSLLGFQAVDLALPSAFPSKVQLLVSGGASTAVIRGASAYILTPTTLQVADLQTRTVTGSAPLTGPVGLDVSGSFAFVASQGLRVLNVQNAASPSVVGSAAAISGTVNDVRVKGDYAYLCASTGLQVFDISDPTHPLGVGLLDSDGGGVQAAVIRGTRAYINDGAYFQPTSMKIVDISNPTLPTLVAKVTSVAIVIEKVAVYGDWAFLTDSNGAGLMAVGINPSSPYYLQHYGPCAAKSGGGNAVGVCATGRFAYVADSAGGLAAIDITDPSALADASLTNTLALSSAKDVTVSGRTAYVSDSTGLEIVALY
jgi:hypothetical protein